MILATFGDIHGHLPALKAVLAAIDEAGIQTIVNTGDCVLGGRWPNEVVDLLRDRSLPTAQGLMDRHVARFIRSEKKLRKHYPDEFDTVAATYEQLHGDNIEYLLGLHKVITDTVDGITIACCHGTPGSVNHVLHENDDLNHFRRQRERADTNILVCGQTHEPFAREVDGTLFVNPGAVSLSPDVHGTASYAIISTEEEPWHATFHTIDY